MQCLLALASVIGLAANVAAQVAYFRVSRRLLRSVFAGFALGAAVTAGVSLSCGFLLELSASDGVGYLIANLTAFGAFGYCYFGFVNMGETARRVRILREFVDAGGSLTLGEVLQRYNGQEIVAVRLGRLLNNGQIVRRDGRYFTGKPAVLVMAQIVEAMKLLVLGKRSEFD